MGGNGWLGACSDSLGPIHADINPLEYCWDSGTGYGGWNAIGSFWKKIFARSDDFARIIPADSVSGLD